VSPPAADTVKIAMGLKAAAIKGLEVRSRLPGQNSIFTLTVADRKTFVEAVH
jgi:hypothetical protein